ncbi:hypothetical protein ACFWC9_10545 [Streptomyces goshikiensis]|uniref:hypothetical protein n=1 Tax=Streptomyces goshikiensis TaxID=1942 RepID=UPI003693D604
MAKASRWRLTGLVCRPRRRSEPLPADCGYDHDHDKYRRLVRATGVKPAIARRGVPHGFSLGVDWSVVERPLCTTSRSASG